MYDPITTSFSTSIAHLLSVVNQISQWMSSNLLCLNPSKTEFIIIGLPAQIKKIPDSSIRSPNNSSFTTFISDAPVRNLGVILILISHSPPPSPTSPAPASCTYAISAASDPCLTLKLQNSPFLNLDCTQIQRLQLIQNSFPRAATRTPQHHHITLVLKSLNWIKNPRAHPLQSP